MIGAVYLTRSEVVVHLAARVHIIKDVSINPIAEFERVNRDATPLIIDGSATSKILDWSPVQLPEKRLEDAVDYYMAHK